MNPVYIFWDQGGMLGQSRCTLSKVNHKVETDDAQNIYNYYQGCMEKHMFLELVRCFDIQWKCTTIITEVP